MYDEALSIAHLPWGPQGYDIAWKNKSVHIYSEIP